MLFDSDFNVTVHNYNDEVLEFSLLYIGAKINDFHIVSVLVNSTLIPLDHCYGDSSHSKGFSGELLLYSLLTSSTTEYHGTYLCILLSGAVVGSVVATILLFLMLVLVSIIVLIAAVYLLRRRKYRNYRLHEVAMENIDE